MAGTFLDLFRGMGTGGAGGNQMTASAPQQAQGGFFDRLDPDLLLSISTGLLTGKTTQEQLGNAALGLAQHRKDQRQRNKTLEILGRDNPDLVKAVNAGLLTPASAFEMAYKERRESLKAQKPSRKFVTLPNGAYGFVDETNQTFTPMGNAQKAESRPALVQEYQFAKEDGFDGDFAEFLKVKKGNENGSGLKAPSGYRWADETQRSLEPIPGGPGEQISGELAARVGMAENFIAGAPALREKIARGDVTGWWDQRFVQNGIGERGQVYQELHSGVDVLLRLLTGAGLNETEARQYAERYLPSGRDTAETATSKLDRLVQELQATSEVATRGRGGFKPSGVRGGRIDDLVRKYGG